jgi:hypothetical protein
VNGADTYRIQPQELIVGGLPNIGLGQGKYVMDYARDDEALPNFFKGLSYASGVGHVVQGYQKALTLGLDGLKAEVNAKLAAKPDADKQAFYRGVLVALEGISEHCLAYARLACVTAARLPEGMAAEKHNLHQVAARMQKLASAAPDTLVEATQLIFTLHAALHLSGEPTAIGRLDQLLQPYYAADLAAGRLDEAGAQEIIMPTVQSGELWKESGRYDDYGPEMLRIKDRHERDMLYGPTHEEVVTDIFRNNIKSYRDLPFRMAEFGSCMRNEAKGALHGLMRVIGFTQEGAVSELEARGLMPSCFMVVNDGSYAAGCVVSCSAEAGAAVEVGSVITVYIAADPSVEITAEPPAASDSDSASSASSGETPADDTQ